MRSCSTLQAGVAGRAGRPGVHRTAWPALWAGPAWPELLEKRAAAAAAAAAAAWAGWPRLDSRLAGPALPTAAGGKVGLIDYGQSKQLPDAYRAAFAMLVLAIGRGDERVGRLERLGGRAGGAAACSPKASAW